MSKSIPEGYELISGRSRENAIKAIALAEERGISSEAVLSWQEGYLVPLETNEVAKLVPETTLHRRGDEIDEFEIDDEDDTPDVIESTDPNGAPVEVQAEKIELPKATASKTEQEAFAAEHGIDLSETTNAETRHAAIVAWSESLPVLGGDDQKED